MSADINLQGVSVDTFSLLLSILNQCYYKGELNIMGVTFVKRSALPAAVKGKVATNSVTITANGQVVLSSLAKNFIFGDKLAIAFDGGKCYMFRADSPTVVKQKLEDKDFQKLNFPKKGTGASFSGTQILNHAKEYGASHVYPYKESGNQTFAVEQNDKGGYLTFELPAEAMTPKPVTKRTKKVKVAPGVSAKAGKVEGTAVDNNKVAVEEDELVLA